ncbi:MAG: phosphonate C-P lyase system protein PhnG [Candidatus Thiodiazotropha sp. 6PLUC7]
MSNLPREQWVRALSAVPEEALASAVQNFPNAWKVTPKALSQEGLGLLKFRDSALGDAFYLGEFPLASCWLSITTPDGVNAEGAAMVMDDRAERAEQMALCDAVLSSRLPGWEAVAKLIDQGCEQLALKARERKTMLAKTRVDFSLLDDVGEEHA